MTVAPIDLSASALRLHHDGRIRAETRTGDPGHDGWRLTAFHVKTDADVHDGDWQVHPEAEEVVSCLIGKIRLLLRPERPGREEQITLTAGTAAIVPRGRWHRIALVTPSTIMAVTLPRGGRPERGTDA
ncbi:cupin [Spirillospora sp. CA-253888]